jgi:lipopolysaccharide/colanic/teichoic acid biosynthesis glycosyltransferase
MADSSTNSTHSTAVRRPWSLAHRAAKRSLDVVAAGLGLIATSPVLLVTALPVRLDSSGPILFKQQRVGRDFVPFSIYKYRTMVVDAEKVGLQITSGRDPRVTRVGRLLRWSKVDELPQLINVLVGDMSLVGPRPEVPKYVELFHDDYRQVLAVRPGITDPASIKYRDEAEQLAGATNSEQTYVDVILPDKIALARQYIAEATFLGDVGILLRTALRIAR